jgi:phosphotransferase system enzyme I (PtsI)
VTLACTGIGVSSGPGIAIGEAYRLQRGLVRVDPVWLGLHQIEAEVQRFREAVAGAADQLRAVRAQIRIHTTDDIVDFVDTHLLMLADKVIAEGPVELIRAEGCSAEWALQLRRDALVQIFEQMDDPYLRSRKDDVDHVIGRIQKLLLSEAAPDEESGDLSGRIALAEDLTPAEAVLLRHRGIAGLITEFGGPMSHTAILARSLGIPALVGARGSTTCLRHGEPLILDARNGVVLADFDAAILQHFESARAAAHAHAAGLRGLRHEPALTRDGRRLELLANVELPEDVATARDNGAEGVGLFRTEFLYMNRISPPSEEEHFEAYRAVLQGMGGLPVTIRTLDLGADKQTDGSALQGSPNPALGLRAIRLCLKEPALFRPQLRALLRVAALGPIRIMLPMLTNLWEVLQTRALIEDVARELAAEGQPFAADIPIGGMIEVPAAALAASSFARHLDFLSIGTNDLIQYTLAIDRVDDEVNYLYDPAHPAVLRLIAQVIGAGRAARISVGMCGEMAGDLRFIPLLIGMGLHSFSMQPNSLLGAKDLIRRADAAQLARETGQLLARLDELETDDLAALLPAIA